MALTNHNTAIELTIAEMREHYCTYAQYLIGPIEVVDSSRITDIFYVGVCKVADVFRYPDAYKNTHWRANITDASRIKTMIVATSPQVAECYKHLQFIVMNYKPICNTLGYQAASRTIITCVSGPNKGTAYLTQEECARLNGISQPSLSNHLNGRDGYANIRGMTFKRGM